MFDGALPAVDVGAAYERVLARRSAARQSWPPGFAGLAIAAAILLALIFTPLGTRALQLLTIFEPTSFTPIAITGRDAGQLRLVPDLRDFGTLRSQRSPSHQVADLTAARDHLEFSPRMLVTPIALPTPVRYVVFDRSTMSFTFSAAKARAYERHYHRLLPSMPLGLDGTTVLVTLNGGLEITYGTRPTGRRGSYDRTLVFGQAPVPEVVSTGASAAALERYMLSMPNIPPDIVRQFRAISDPATTLPVPFRIDRQAATTVEVDGVRGLSIGDETGLGAAVVWQKGAMIYAIAGPMKQSDILALANALQ
jgi:hypothetical protein